MTGNRLRAAFLEFFRAKGHAIVPSDSLVPAKDATLLFTGAGMNQFKEYFLGHRRDMKRAASCQKCFRTGDVEQVGLTPSHLTFFEMLGNFSFGDYFKEEAIAWAWEFMTQTLGISPDKLCATVYEKDDEAYEIWKKKIGLAPERIYRFGAKDNFWPSNAPTEGPNGPCGPCSELHFDYGRCLIGKVCPDPDRCSPGCPCGRFVEVWNLVFTQFDRQSDGSLPPLPAKNIDTGMGLERLTAVMQDKMSVFETDLFEPILQEIVRSLGEEAPETLKASQRASVHAVADHVRALTFLITDGVIPSNEGRGYVLRMLLRKAVRAGRQIGFSKPFLYRLVPVVERVMAGAYPELTHRRESIAKVIQSEEERFRQTLEEKLPLLRQGLRSFVRPEHVEGRTIMVRQAHHDRNTLSAETAARFYDTHGLSYEEIVEVCAQEKVAPPSRKEFDRALTELQARSRTASKFEGAIFAPDKLAEVVGRLGPTSFIGYSRELQVQVRVVGLVQDLRAAEEVRAPAQLELVLDRSPFYGEAGGQVGDQGTIEGPEGRIRILDTQWVGNVLIHRGEVEEGKIRVGHPVKASVDVQRRRRVAQNHTATHLLHSALRKVLGNHVVQAGSLVAPDHLRFDFSHSQGLTAGEKEAVEGLVAEWVESGLPVSVAEMSLDQARAAGATALFGEKYGNQVRVVSIGDVSKELCGGTHLKTSSEVGLIALVEEGSVAAGMRRIEALTGREAFKHLRREVSELEETARRLKAPLEGVGEAVEKLLKRTKVLEDENAQLKLKGAHAEVKNVISEHVGSFNFFSYQFEKPMDHAELRAMADAIRKAEPEAIIFLADPRGFCVATSGATAQTKGIGANNLLGVSNKVAGGAGGGRPAMAMGRIEQPSRFVEVRGQLISFIEKHSTE